MSVLEPLSFNELHQAREAAATALKKESGGGNNIIVEAAKLPTAEEFSTNRLTPWLLPFQKQNPNPVLSSTMAVGNNNNRMIIAALDISLNDDVYDPLSPYGQPKRLRNLITAPDFHKSPQKAVLQFNEILNES